MNDQAPPTKRGTARTRVSRTLFLLLAVIATSVFSYNLYQRNQEERQFAGFESVVRLVHAGQLLPNSQGDILLPQRWSWLTKNGHVYECNDKTDGTILLFPTDVDTIRIDWGKGTIETKLQIAGYLYCAAPRPKSNAFMFPRLDEVQLVPWMRLAPHWSYVEPWYS